MDKYILSDLFTCANLNQCPLEWLYIRFGYRKLIKRYISPEKIASQHIFEAKNLCLLSASLHQSQMEEKAIFHFPDRISGLWVPLLWHYFLWLIQHRFPQSTKWPFFLHICFHCSADIFTERQAYSSWLNVTSDFCRWLLLKQEVTEQVNNRERANQTTILVVFYLSKLLILHIN